jgi:hypothetical protein
MRHIAVLAIANRLGANQALGDMVERVARVQRVSGWNAGLIQTRLYHRYRRCAPVAIEPNVFAGCALTSGRLEHFPRTLTTYRFHCQGRCRADRVVWCLHVVRSALALNVSTVSPRDAAKRTAQAQVPGLSLASPSLLSVGRGS